MSDDMSFFFYRQLSILYLYLLPYFLCSREVYRSSQQQFSRARMAQRKFRMEPEDTVNSFAQISSDILAEV